MGKFYVPVRRSAYLTIGTVNKMLPFYKTKIFILCYHGIGEDNWAFSVNKKTFEKQINYLKSQKIEFITLSDIEKFLNGEKKITKPSVVITFDDGYKDILEVSNFLKKKNIKPTLFLLSNTKNANRKELANERPFLSKKEILYLKKNGWELGSHTATHSDMFGLNAQQIEKEVIESKRSLEKELGIQIPYIAYPKGRYTHQILNAVKKADYKLGVSMDDGFISKIINKYTIPRIGVDRTHSIAEFKTLFMPMNIKFRKALKNIGYGK